MRLYQNVDGEVKVHYTDESYQFDDPSFLSDENELHNFIKPGTEVPPCSDLLEYSLDWISSYFDTGRDKDLERRLSLFRTYKYYREKGVYGDTVLKFITTTGDLFVVYSFLQEGTGEEHRKTIQVNKEKGVKVIEADRKHCLSEDGKVYPYSFDEYKDVDGLLDPLDLPMIRGVRIISDNGILLDYEDGAYLIYEEITVINTKVCLVRDEFVENSAPVWNMNGFCNASSLCVRKLPITHVKDAFIYGMDMFVLYLNGNLRAYSSPNPDALHEEDPLYQLIASTWVGIDEIYNDDAFVAAVTREGELLIITATNGPRGYDTQKIPFPGVWSLSRPKPILKAAK